MSRLMKPRELEAEYGIPLSHQKELLRLRRIPVVKVGRANYFDRRQIERWIEANTREAEAS